MTPPTSPRSPAIVVVGSYVHAFTIAVPRMPGDGETVIGSGSDVGPGGKGSNQAIQAARLGARVELLACVGDDAFGRAARELWAAEGLGTELVTTDPARATGLAFIIVDEAGQNRIVVDVGANVSLSPAGVRRAEDAIAAADLVMAQLEPPVDAVVEAFRIARRHGVRTMLNPAPARPLGEDLLPLVDVLVPNLTEAEELSAPEGGAFDVAGAAAALRARGPGTVVVTLEERGAYVLDEGGGRRVPGIQVGTVDSTGAGDAFCGALGVALGRGAPIDGAVAFANRAGAFCVTRVGVVPGLATEDRLPAPPAAL